MQVRHSTHPSQIPGMTTDELRDHYLVETMFVDDKIEGVYVHDDRVIMLGITPATEPIKLEAFPELRTDTFFERREAGIVNIGAPGVVTVDGVEYPMETNAVLYIGRGSEEVVFASGDEGTSKFYLYSAPAHTTYPTVLKEPGTGNTLELGDQANSNRRSLNQYIYPGGVDSCQVMMGVTQLHEGSMWNTMPAHTHDRRAESYLYFGIPEDARVVHLMGEPQETRHMIVANEQAIISPSWSIHSGVGTAAYTFVWAMAGENMDFDDMDPAPITEMK